MAVLLELKPPVREEKHSLKLVSDEEKHEKVDEFVKEMVEIEEKEPHFES
jgi:hypothetical protein